AKDGRLLRLRNHDRRPVYPVVQFDGRWLLAEDKVGQHPPYGARRRLATCVEHALHSDPAVAAALRRNGITISGSNPRQPIVSLSDSGPLP
ncbi:MAG: hypothetical protein ACXVXP_10425, partial [Mycobacteriaceae bacterium]